MRMGDGKEDEKKMKHHLKRDLCGVGVKVSLERAGEENISINLFHMYSDTFNGWSVTDANV